jgi:hypothetical protein
MSDRLVAEDLAERRARARVLARAQRRAQLPPLPPLEDLLAALERRVDEPYTLRRVAGGDYEARTFSGDAGFGASHAEALVELIYAVAA